LPSSGPAILSDRRLWSSPNAPKELSERIVGIETTDKLTDPQIVAKVKEHCGIDR